MKKPLLIFLFSLFVFHFTLAQQGTIQLPATGQTTSFYPGDDGDLKRGVPLPANRFISHGNGSATDQFTGLMWATDANLIATRNPAFDQDRTPGDGDIDWQTALDYIALLNNEKYLGYSDWLLPDVMELRSLLDLDKDSVGLPPGHPFINLKGGYWSSTTPDRFRGMAVMVCLSKYYVHAGTTLMAGHVEGFNKNLDLYSSNYIKAFALPVRDAGSAGTIGIPESGQQISFYQGDDGDILSGTTWPSPRFVDNKNETVTDRLSGLMWTKDANLMYSRNPEFGRWGMVNWTDAMDYVALLNNENYLGHTDWRLPNRNELSSLLDYSRNTPCLPLDHPFIHAATFSDSSITSCWSSTTLKHDTTRAWDVYFVNGFFQDRDKDSETYVWPVRTDNSSLPSGSIHGEILGEEINKAGIEIAITGPVDAKTRADASGHYVFASIPDGTYQIIPDHNYYTFSPLSKWVIVSGSAVSCDFSAAFNRAYGWTDISAGLFPLEDATGTTLHGLYFINDQEGWITSTQDIYHTTDGGRTFEAQKTLDFCSAIFMFNENEGYAGGNGGWIYRTANGGDNWMLVNSIGANVTDISFAPGTTTGFCCGGNGQFWRIKPAGLEKIYTGYATTISGISSLSASTAVFVAGTHIVYYDGSTFISMSHPGGYQADLHLMDGSLGWMVGDAGGISGLVDLQTSWVVLKPLDETGNETLYSVYSPNGKDVWAVGNKGLIQHSPNGDDFYFNTVWDYGNNTIWNTQAAGLTNESLDNVFFTSPTNGYAVGSNGVILKYGLLEGAPEGADILGISLAGQVGNEIIDKENHTVYVKVPQSADISKIIPEIFLSAGATVNPPGGEPRDFTSPVVYTVTSSDGALTQNWTVSVSFYTSVDLMKMPEMMVYPNPCSGEVSLRSGIGTQQPSVLKLYSIEGVVVMEEDFLAGSETFTLNVKQLPAGVYFARLIINNQLIVKKMIKLQQ